MQIIPPQLFSSSPSGLVVFFMKHFAVGGQGHGESYAYLELYNSKRSTLQYSSLAHYDFQYGEMQSFLQNTTEQRKIKTMIFIT